MDNHDNPRIKELEILIRNLENGNLWLEPEHNSLYHSYMEERYSLLKTLNLINPPKYVTLTNIGNKYPYVNLTKPK